VSTSTGSTPDFREQPRRDTPGWAQRPQCASADALAVRESRDRLQREIDLLAAKSEPGREAPQTRVQAVRARITDESQIQSMIAAHTRWYHRIELAPGIVTPGINDSNANLRILDHLGLPTDCSGMRVLDIGTADGFMAFEIEKRGADEVVGLDYRKPTSSGFCDRQHDSRQPCPARGRKCLRAGP